MKYQPLFPGQKFNRLTIIKLDHKKKYIYPNGRIIFREYYLCKCDCGNKKIAYKWDIKSGHTKSCGCWKDEIRKIVHTKHGQERTRLYKIWQGIKKRCYRKTFQKYNLYGGRGITVCDEWKNNFIPFFNWAMSNGYKDNLTIDRIDVNGNYEPSNCRWCTQKQQMRNTRRNHLLTINGKTKCIAEWAEVFNIPYKTLYSKIKRGLPIDKVL